MRRGRQNFELKLFECFSGVTFKSRIVLIDIE